MKKNKKENGWWSGLTAEDMNNSSRKKSPKKKMSELWSDIYADVDRSPNKPKKSKK
jgi:hypothetical protein